MTSTSRPTPGPASAPVPPHGGAAVNPTSLSVEELARLLSAPGNDPVSVEDVLADLEAGAPVLPGGRVNLVHYAAWLLREVDRP